MSLRLGYGASNPGQYLLAESTAPFSTNGSLPGPQKHVRNGIKPLETARKAVLLHAIGVQYGAIISDFLHGRPVTTSSVPLRGGFYN